MSHTSRYAMKVKDTITLKSVLKAKKIEFKENCKVQLYGSNKVDAAISFKLDGWKYECAVTKDGDIMFDHFGSKSHSFDRLGEVVQEYNKQAIMKKAYGFAENWWSEPLVNDGIKIVLEY